MKAGLSIVGAIAFGAGAVYLLDPARGHRRRTVLRDMTRSRAQRAAHLGARIGRDMGNRGRGVIAELRACRRGEVIDDTLLVERVRAAMGGYLRHPGWVSVQAARGQVTLTGSIVDDELGDLLDCVAAVRGVRAVENHLVFAPAAAA
jgi:osmotically-inducible protein OsmY